MPHLLLIHEPTGQRAGRSRAEGEALYAAMRAWGEGLAQRGLLVAGESLAPQDARAARVQRGAAGVQVLDGPFAEAKEMVGGFFLLATDSREEALALAAQCPAAAWATVEVRATAPCWQGSPDAATPG